MIYINKVAKLAAADSDQILNFAIRYENLGSFCDEFNKYHSALVSNIAVTGEGDVDLEEQVRQEFDDIFYSIKTIYSTLVRPVHTSNLNTGASTSGYNANNAKSNAKLPKISLPTFSGDIKEWPMYIGLFNALVHTCTELKDIEKFQYLLSTLSKEALTAVKYVPVRK